MKNADTAGSKGYDAGKKVSGIKRHIAVDTQGLPHAIALTTADVTDRQGALQAFKRCKGALGQVQSVLTDGGYTGEPFAQGVREILGEQVTVQVAKRSELHTFKVMPKRWVVERSFAWLDKNRLLWKNCERWLNTSLQFVHLAFLGHSWYFCSKDCEHFLTPVKRVHSPLHPSGDCRGAAGLDLKLELTDNPNDIGRRLSHDVPVL